MAARDLHPPEVGPPSRRDYTTAAPATPAADMLGNLATQQAARQAEEEARTEAQRLLDRWLATRRNARPADEQDVRRYLERQLGVDLAGVPFGSQAPAGAMAAAVSGRVELGAGAPPASSPEGFRVRAHEVIHVIQQGAAPSLAGRSSWRSGAVANPTVAPPVLFDGPSLAPTPGGLRLGALDPAALAKLVELIKPLIRQGDFYAIQTEYIKKWNNRDLKPEEVFYDLIRRPIVDARSSIDNDLRSDPRHDETLEALLNDEAVLIARVFEQAAIDAKKLEHDVGAVGDTYQRLVYLYRYQQLPIYGPIAAETRDKRDEFERRSRIFLEFTKDKLGTGSAAFNRVAQGLAADVSRLMAGELETEGKQKIVAPDRAGELLVWNLIADTSRIEDVVALFARVVDDARIGAPLQASTLLYMMESTYAEELIKKPIREQIGNVTDPTTRESNRRTIAIWLGQFLARLKADNITASTGAFFWGYLVVTGNPAPDALNDQQTKAIEEVNAPAPPTPVVTPKPVPQVVVAPPGHQCRATYSLEDVAAYFNAKLGLAKVTAPTFVPKLLVCQFRGYHPEGILAKTTTHLGQWRAGADRVAAELAGQARAAKQRHDQIGRLRAQLAAEEAKEAVTDFPELPKALYVAQAFWFLLGAVPWDNDIDSSDQEAAAAKSELKYFVALSLHQKFILQALTMIVRAKKERLDVYLKDRYADTLSLDYLTLRDRVLITNPWPGPDQDELEQVDGLEAEVKRIQVVLDQVDKDRAAEHRLEIEDEIYRKIDAVVNRIWLVQPNHDLLSVDEVYKLLRPGLTSLRGDEDDATAKEILKTVLADVHRARAAQLFGDAQAAVIGGNARQATERAHRLQALLSRLDTPVPGASPDAILDLVRGQTTNMIGLFVMAQTSLVVGQGVMRVEQPGHVARAANLLRLALEAGESTLEGAYSWVVRNETELWADMQDPEKRLKVTKDTNKSFFDSLELGIGSMLTEGASVIGPAVSLLKSSHANGALKFLIAAEGKEGEDKKAAIAEFAEFMRAKKPSHSKAVAAFIYSYLLDAVDELQSAGEQLKARKKAGEEAQKKKKERLERDAKRTTPKTVAEQKEEAEWDDQISKADRTRWPFAEEMIGVERGLNVVDVFDSGQHPVHKRPLTEQEKDWWQAFKDIEGEGNIILPGEKGWAEIGEFAKGLVTAAAIGAVTGGIGGLVSGALELEALTTVVTIGGTQVEIGVGAALVTIGEVTAFTELTRIQQEIETGERPATGFARDLLVNLAMTGAGKFAVGRMARSLERQGIGGLRARVNLFAAEYLATSGVGIANLYLGALFEGGTVTHEDVRQNLLHNFGFVVGMKVMHALGEGPKGLFKNEAKTWKDRQIADRYEALAVDLDKRDQDIKLWLKELANADTPDKKADILERIAKREDMKADAIENSGIPDAKEVAAAFRDAVGMFRVDAKRAVLLERVGAKPLLSTANLSYETGSANEAALEKHFEESGNNFRIERDAAGRKTYVVTTVDGEIRYVPRDPATGGTAQAAYTPTTRIQGEVVPDKHTGDPNRVETGEDVVKILKSTPKTVSKFIPTPAEAFVLTAPGGATCRVAIKVGDPASGATHATGPASFSLSRVNGEWVAEITVNGNVPNDHIVRGVNHEVTELVVVLDRLEQKAAEQNVTPDVAYDTPEKLKAAIEPEVSAGPKGPGKPMSAHEAAVLNADLVTLGKQMQEVTSMLDALPFGDFRRPMYEARLKLLQQDFGAVWTLLDLPVNRAAFEKRMDELKKANAGLTPEALTTLRGVQFQRERHETISYLDLQIIFNELAKANPNLVEEGSFLRMKVYFEKSVRRKAEEAMDEARKQRLDSATVLARGLEVCRQLLGGTNIASWRGRVFEGLVVEEFNNNPDLLEAYGRMFKIEKNNFPTYDIVGIKIAKDTAAASVKGVPTPLSFEVEPVLEKGKPTGVEVLVIKDGNGREVARQRPDGTMWQRPGVEVTLASLKAKGRAEIKELKKAVGTPDKPTGQIAIVNKELAADIDKKIEFAQGRVDALTGQKGKARELGAAKKRLELLQFIKDNTVVSEKWSIEKIDAVLEELKALGVDVEEIEREIQAAAKKKSGQ